MTNSIPAPTPVVLLDRPYGYVVLAKHPKPLLDARVFTDVVNGVGKGGWFRFQQYLKDMDPQGTMDASKIDWSGLDYTVKACEKVGLHVCFPLDEPADSLVTTVCDTLHDGAKVCLPTADCMGKYASLVATRYNGKTKNPDTGEPYGLIRAIEVNEQYDIKKQGEDLTANPPVFSPCRNGAFFAPVLKAMYSAVKAASPDTLVGTAALFGERQTVDHYYSWVSALFAAGCQWDYTNLHFYHGKYAPDVVQTDNNDPPLGLAIASITKAHHDAGHGQRDIWITEIGWTIEDPNRNPTRWISEDEQAQFSQEALDIARKSDNVTHVFFYTIGSNYQGRGQAEGMSLTWQDWSVATHGEPPVQYRPAYTAIQTYATKDYPTWPTSVATSSESK